MADHQVGNDHYRDGIDKPVVFRLNAESREEKGRRGDNAAAGRYSKTHKVAVDYTGVDIESCKAPHSAEGEENSRRPAEFVIMVHAEGIGEEGRSNSERAEIAERVHLLAHLTDGVECPGDSTVETVGNQRNENEDSAAEVITMIS